MKILTGRREFLKKVSCAGVLTGVLGPGVLVKGGESSKEFDLVIRGGTVFDGLSDQPQEVDVGISSGRIRRMGSIPAVRGQSAIDARGLAVCPGFIDVHNHSDVQLLVEPQADSYIRQGVTTVVGGNCGFSRFPIAAELVEETRAGLREKYQIELTWTDMEGFLARLARRGTALNYATLVGHGAIRGQAMGLHDRPPTRKELEVMKRMVAGHMKKGALGLSTGLVYSPGSYAQTAEITELCKVAAKYGGIYATHMRSEGDRLLEAIDEAVGIARRAGISLQISHLKAAYPRNWQKLDAALKKIDRARRSGISVHCDRYPYVAGSTSLGAYFPSWSRQGTTTDFLARLKDPARDGALRAYLQKREKKLGSWEKVTIAQVILEKNKSYEGKSIKACALESGQQAYDFIRDLLIEEKDRVSMISFIMTEENLTKILGHPLVGIASDGSVRASTGILGQGKPHPRMYGTFPRALGKYVRQEKVASLGGMIRKMTSDPARKFGLAKRGVLQEGHAADVVILDPDKVEDRATFAQPHRYPRGIHYVLVNGTPVVVEGEHTGSLPGKILRKTV